MKSAVVDTNIFVSALTGSRTCRQIIDLFRADTFKLVLSSDLLSELADVLSRPCFNFKPDDTEKIIRFIRRRAVKVLPDKRVSVCRDEKDNIVLECALCGKADFIVTGDEDLLSLKTFHKTLIITPRKFLELIKK